MHVLIVEKHVPTLSNESLKNIVLTKSKMRFFFFDDIFSTLEDAFSTLEAALGTAVEPSGFRSEAPTLLGRDDFACAIEMMEA